MDVFLSDEHLLCVVPDHVSVLSHAVCVPCDESLALTLTSVCVSASFHRLDHLMVSVSVNLETEILRSKSALVQHVPPGEPQSRSPDLGRLICECVGQ